MSLLWPSLNPNHIGMIKISKWSLFDVENKNTIFVPFKIEWVLDPNVDINLALEIYTKLSSIWYIGLCVRADELERERPLNDAKRSQYKKG